MAESKALALLADLESAGALSVTGLHLADLPYEQFEALCVLLGRMHEAVRFAIGDACIHAEKLYGERGYQALEHLGLSERAKLEYVRVAQKVPRSIRREDLSWSHHRAVAPLELPQQKQWLRRASEEHLSHHELREELRNGAPAKRTTCHCCGRPLDE